MTNQINLYKFSEINFSKKEVELKFIDMESGEEIIINLYEEQKINNILLKLYSKKDNLAIQQLRIMMGLIK